MARSREIKARKPVLRLTPEQRQVLIGLLLGEAHLETPNRGRTYGLKIEHGETRRAYVEHLYRLFEPWVPTPPQPKRVVSQGSESTNWWFQTVSHSAFRFYAHQFYRDGRKCVPKLIHRWLTPVGLAYWFMDDGSLKWEQSRVVLFNTHGFERREVERLCHVLNRNFALEATLRRQREGYQLVILGRSLERFVELVGPHLLPEMAYQLPRAGRTHLPKK